MVVGCLKASSPPPPPRGNEEGGGKEGGEGRRTTFTTGILHLRGLSVTISQQPLKHPRTETLRREERGTRREGGGAWTEGGAHKEGGGTCKEGETRKEGGTEREEAPSSPGSALEVVRACKGVCGAKEWGGVEVKPNHHFAPARTHLHPHGPLKDQPHPHTPPRIHRSPRPARAPPRKSQDPGHPMWYLTPTSGALLLLQGILLTLTLAFVRYNDMADAADLGNNFHPILRGNNLEDNPATIRHYSLVLTLVLVLVCPGLRLAPLEDACLSATATFLLVTCLVIQWAILCRGFLHGIDFIQLDIFSLLEACEVCVGVGVGVWLVLGRTNPLRVVVAALLYVPHHIANALISIRLKVMDRGGSVCVHTFGAAFGAGLRWGLGGKKSSSRPRVTASKTAQLTSLLGTLTTCVLLCEVWAWKTAGDDHHRALLNTCLALVAACLTAFPTSSLTHPRRKVTVSDVECGVLGGCVAVSGVAEMMVGAWGSVLLGALASIASVLTRRLLLPSVWGGGGGDGDGVVVAHGVGGVLGGLAGAVMATIAKEGSMYGDSVYELYPALAPVEESDDLAEINKHFIIKPGEDRLPSDQALLTLATLVATLPIALLAGALTGVLLRLPVFGKRDGEDMISDECYWQLPSPPPPPPPLCHHHHHHHC